MSSLQFESQLYADFTTPINFDQDFPDIININANNSTNMATAPKKLAEFPDFETFDSFDYFQETIQDQFTLNDQGVFMPTESIVDNTPEVRNNTNNYGQENTSYSVATDFYTQRPNEDFDFTTATHRFVAKKSVDTISTASTGTYNGSMSPVTHKLEESTSCDGNHHSCGVCGKAYKHKSSLVRHTRKHAVVPYECKVCHKRFNENTHLANHMRVHTGEKPYSCAKCSKRFTTLSNLIQHQKRKTSCISRKTGIHKM
eukprot:CAMPEP_0115015998 /NCGR_PEP_ID=MMETSP0216-20121206/27137_1 /TAXON_ID=223996 /ORGANISM="Protocruzia adherens, Strain Boccale" /LENGTH=256 /DNA_ID=CAMNT_0002386295 /DNA_START=305 /DNA_END=1075 /DNA_ORIENTATION=+